MINRLPELLCPAGGEAALRAAVDCGADAVYLGYKAYGARASAVNFDDDALLTGVNYAHLHHVRVHVTVNTLVKDGELSGVEAALTAIQRAGADAVIVQDLGVARLVRDQFPDLELHASTQMALSNASDARFAKKLGFSRVVLARECALSDIRRVVETGIETEVFAHGALCAGVSGRCLTSSMAGGRSGNRGRCAQPCRLGMSLGDLNGALLSLRDLCTLQDLPVICDAGVSSLKIEGRLKSPDYVAVVTGVYRRALDAIAAGSFDPHDLSAREALLQIFNRGGFTRGHIMNAQDADLCASHRVSHEGLPLGTIVDQRSGFARVRVCRTLHDGDSLQLRSRTDSDLRYSGPETNAGSLATLRLRPDICVETGSEVARLSDAKQLEAARSHLSPSIPITMTASFALDKPMSLSLSDGGSTVTVEGEPAQAAASRAATADDVSKQLSKLGETPFHLPSPDSLTITLENGLFLPVSVLNALRRSGTAVLEAERIRAFRQPPRMLANSRTASQNVSSSCDRSPVTTQTLAVSFTQPELGSALADSGASLLIYRPRDYRPQALSDALSLLPPGAWLKLPPQISQRSLEAVEQVAANHQGRLGGFVAGSFGQLALNTVLPVIAGEEIPVTNREALLSIHATDACAFTLWPEWIFTEQVDFLPHALPALLKVYGRETLMLLNHCPARVRRGLTAEREKCTLCIDPAATCGQLNAELTDQKGYRFPLQRTMLPEGCVISMLNALPTDLRAYDDDRRRLGAGMLLAFTVEPPQEQLALTRAYAALLQGEQLPKAERVTAGHWKRGVE